MRRPACRGPLPQPAPSGRGHRQRSGVICWHRNQRRLDRFERLLPLLFRSRLLEVITKGSSAEHKAAATSVLRSFAAADSNSLVQALALSASGKLIRMLDSQVPQPSDAALASLLEVLCMATKHAAAASASHGVSVLAMRLKGTVAPEAAGPIARLLIMLSLQAPWQLVQSGAFPALTAACLAGAPCSVEALSVLLKAAPCCYDLFVRARGIATIVARFEANRSCAAWMNNALELLGWLLESSWARDPAAARALLARGLEAWLVRALARAPGLAAIQVLVTMLKVAPSCADAVAASGGAALAVGSL